MNTKINLTYKGEKYVLEYDRMSVKILEDNGFILDELLTKAMTNIELAFTAAFIKNHRKTSQTVIDEIYKTCRDKNDLVLQLHKMIKETYDSLLADPETNDEGNATWEVIDLSPKKSQK